MNLQDKVRHLMSSMEIGYVRKFPAENYKFIIPDGMQEYDMITRNSSNCNNVSMATLQYMERYQLLSSKDRNLSKFNF